MTSPRPVWPCPNDPDNVKCSRRWPGAAIDEVFIGSLYDQHRPLPGRATVLKGAGSSQARLWSARPPAMDDEMLRARATTAHASRRRRPHGTAPACSLCMGNQARVDDNTNRVLASTQTSTTASATAPRCTWAGAELAAVCACWATSPPRPKYLEIAAAKMIRWRPIFYRYPQFSIRSRLRWTRARVLSSAEQANVAGGGLGEGRGPLMQRPSQRRTKPEQQRASDVHDPAAARNKWLAVVLAP